VEGVHRFLSRVYRFISKHGKRTVPAAPGSDGLSPQSRGLQRKLHQTIKRVSDDFTGRWHFNTCIAAIMELVNELYAVEPDIEAGRVPSSTVREVQRNLVLLLHPFAPYLAHELWEMLGESSNLLREPWPQYDPELAKEDEVEYAVQINGKVRSRILVRADASEEESREKALAAEKVQAAIAGKKIVKVIVVPGKLVNLVVR
jgi:leucyl-tRNA synthetase